MVYHNENITSGPSLEYEEDGIKVHQVSASYAPPQTISVHYAPSSTMPWAEIAALSPEVFAFSDDLTAEWKFGNIGLRIEPSHVQASGEFMHSSETGRCAYHIGDTSYRIECPGKIHRFADRWTPEREEKVLMVSVISADGEPYGLFQERPWSLTVPGWDGSFLNGEEFVLEKEE